MKISNALKGLCRQYKVMETRGTMKELDELEDLITRMAEMEGCDMIDAMEESL